MAIIEHLADENGFTVSGSEVRWADFKVERGGAPFQEKNLAGPCISHRPASRSFCFATSAVTSRQAGTPKALKNNLLKKSVVVLS